MEIPDLAAQLVACRPEAYPLDSVFASMRRMMDNAERRYRELKADRDAYERDEMALRKHFRSVLERLDDAVRRESWHAVGMIIESEIRDL